MPIGGYFLQYFIRYAENFQLYPYRLKKNVKALYNNDICKLAFRVAD